MKIEQQLVPADQQLIDEKLRDFVPHRVFDVHAHPMHSSHFLANPNPLVPPGAVWGLDTYRAAMARWLPAQQVDGLFFGFPRAANDRRAINMWLAQELKSWGRPNSRALALVAANDDPAEVGEQIAKLGLTGIKPYHVYADRPDTMNATIEEFAPEWMWEMCHAMQGVLMLHIVRERAMSDEGNQAALRRLCRAYPNCRVVLAHVARSFNYRHAYEGLSTLRDLDNVCIDTSAVTSTLAFRKAIEVLGPRRVLFGTDYPVSEFRGKCTAVGDSFCWLYSDTLAPDSIPTGGQATLVGIESLLCLREACEDSGLTQGDIQDIFHDNALRLLAPHLETIASNTDKQSSTGPELWSEAKTKISGGTGLLSKRAHIFDPQSWPSYFSRCSGCEVWDTEGRRFIDFAGGIGAILLGYADPDVTRAVQRRLDMGTWCTLVSPDEPELAELLLELHPWAGRVRFARGGGEAMTIAVRIARAATGKSGVAFCGYHGWQDWYLAANLADDAALDGHLLPGLQPLGVPRELRGTAVGFRYNDVESLDAALNQLDGRLAAVVMEPMRGQWPENNFLETVAGRCRAAGGVFVVDEITSGWRYGFPGALATLGVEPDIVAYAKAISNGFPCAAVVGREAVMDAANDSFISSSYWTDGIGPAAALRCIHKMRDLDVQQTVWERGERLQASLNQLAARHPAACFTVGGMPCAPALAFNLGPASAAAKTLMVRKMLAKGFLISSQIYIMLAHDDAKIELMLGAMEAVLGEIAGLAAVGRLQEEAGVEQSTTGFTRLT